MAKYKIVEIEPAVVIHCSDVENRKFYYIHIFEGPPSSPTFKVFDDLDHELPGVALVNLCYSDVAERYRALVNYEKGTIELNIIGTTPWQKQEPSALTKPAPSTH